MTFAAASSMHNPFPFTHNETLKTLLLLYKHTTDFTEASVFTLKSTSSPEMQRQKNSVQELVWNICTVVASVIFVVDDEQNDTQEEANGAHSDVGDAQEWIFPSHPGDGAQDHSFATIEAEYRVI